MAKVRLFKKADDGVIISTPHDDFQGGVHVQQQLIQFSADLSSGETVSMDIDGTNVTQAFHTDHVTTMSELAAQLYTMPNVLHSEYPGFRAIVLTAKVPGLNIHITNAIVEGSLFASGTVTYGEPADGDTLVVDGTTFTKVASDPAESEFTSASELTALIDALETVNATVNDGIITIEAAEAGVAGNSIALSKTGSALTLSGSTLEGGYSTPTISVLGNDPYELTFDDLVFPSFTNPLDFVDIDIEDLPSSNSIAGDWHERLYFDGSPALENLIVDTDWDYMLKPFGLVRKEYMDRIRGLYDAELAGTAATGTVTYGTPADDDTLAVDGTTFTKVASSPGANEFSNISELTALIQALSSVNATDNGTVITITAATSGSAGNSITLVRSGSSLTPSDSTLTGGADPNPVTLFQYQRNIDAVYQNDEMGSTANNYESTRMTSPLDEPKDEWALFWCNRDLDNLNAGADRANYRIRLNAKIADIEAAIAGR